ncbi:uncharacterized protein LOC124497539 [Dermatophagoides farinae]|uniref:Uncharacterized protein n=1 Tax=Dermatophagoides farinae TaxID=6954 RepID=A0A922KZV1_DERFA|nr:hypothetical protein DERF_011685 [Dermatophagoides farinae]
MDTAKRLAYLQQLQNLLINQHHHHLDSNSNSLIKLNSFYGYLGKEISMKHNVQILNCDPLKLYRCKRCYCQYDFQSIIEKRIYRMKTSKRRLCFECPQCSYPRTIIFRQRTKTKWEKYLDQQSQPSTAPPPPQQQQQQQRPSNRKQSKSSD